MSCCKKKQRTPTGQFRKIRINEYPRSQSNSQRASRISTREDDEDYPLYPPNVTKTSSYTILSFFPVATFRYFSKYTNAYFLFMTILLSIPAISPFSLGSVISPMIFIYSVSMIREGYEDYLRHKSDKESNNSKCLVIEKGVIREEFWRNVRLGDVIIVPKDNRIPADLFLLSAATPDGTGFMETSTLDGEKHLKPRFALKEILSCVTGELHYSKGQVQGKLNLDIDMNIYVPEPNPSLYNFEGFLKFFKKGQEDDNSVSIGIKNYLFKGAMIRNVDWVLGCVVYTGTDTKIQQNGADARFKISSVERKMHKMIIILFLIQILMSFVAVFVRMIYDKLIDDNFDEWLEKEGVDDNNNLFFVFIRYFILLSTLIPISLIVGLELTRLTQAYFIYMNMDLKNKEKNIPCKVSTTTINEELGQIEYVLTDKTGTLTQNKMILRGLCIGDKLFGGKFELVKSEENYGPEGIHKKKREEHTFEIKSKTHFDEGLEEFLGPHKGETFLPYGMDVWTEARKEPPKLSRPFNSEISGALSARSIDPHINTSKPAKKNFTFREKFRHEDDEMNEFICRDTKLFSQDINFENLERLSRHGKNGAQMSKVEKRNSVRQIFVNKASLGRNFPTNLNGGTVFKSYEELTKEFILCAALNHECLVQEDDDGNFKYTGSSPDEIAICQGAKYLGVEFKGNSLGTSTVDYCGEEMQFKVPIIFDFDSTRKRSSMIVYDGANYKLLVKGADSSILPNLTKKFHHPYQEDIELYLTKFSLLGYRTLVFGEKYLTKAQYENIKRKYQRAMNSGNRKVDVKKLANEVETDLILLGCTAVEDALQLKVKDAVTRLLQADIKVWMITGDKLETAENIGLMAGIVTHEMETFYIENVNKKNFMEVAKKLKSDMNKIIKTGEAELKGNEVKLAIVFDMRSVDFIFSNYDENIKEANTLAELLMKADSVICARSTPKQKAKIVNFVRKRNKICLAIGDGANDVNMIREANIGVGLYGEEGLQAVQSADFALANFRFLWKLILIEGRMNHLRVTTFIYLFLYKNIVFTMVQFVFGFYCFWSGLTFYDDWYITLFNLVFTAYAIAYLGSMDQDIRYRTYLKNKEKAKKEEFDNKVVNELGELSASDMESVLPYKSTKVQKVIKDNFQHLYYMTQKNLFYSFELFWWELFDGTLDGIVITFCIFGIFQNISLNVNGYTPDFWVTSIIIYSILIIATNVKTLFRAAHITYLLLFCIFVTSILPFYLFIIVYDHMTYFNEHSIYSARFTLGTWHYWSAVLLGSFYVCFLELCKFIGKYYFNPSMVEYVKQLKKYNLLDQENVFSKDMLNVIKKHHLKELKNKRITKSKSREMKKARWFRAMSRGGQ